MRSRSRLVLVSAALLHLAGCEREVRPFQTLPAASARKQPDTGQDNPFRENAYGIAEGKRLFAHYNCSGCHANGGGGMGPALMDDRWIYGFQGANVYETIVEGRPNGMPAFRNKISDQQVWMLVAYVHSLSGNAPMDALPGRSDHMRPGTPENARPAQVPRQTGPW
jgi:cytochrome c oxidase cbb3-type subunit 3